jgi:signal transduction histidine kinase
VRTADLVERLLRHLGEIGGGRCSITEATIEAEQDPAVREILVGLLILHEDLELAERRRAQIDAQRHEADQQREVALEDARIAVAARDEFLSVASHELRTPITTLSLQLELLLRLLRTNQLDPSALSQGVEMAHRQGQRLQQLVGNLLDVSRLTAGPVAKRHAGVDLVAIVRDVITRLDLFIRKSGSDITLTADVEVRGCWDPSRLDQVAGNLLTNAIKYGGGRPIAVVVEGRPGIARLSVQDEGIGLSVADQERIFWRFERAVSSQDYAGLGLGLWICRQIVLEHHGRITVDSQLGKGSTFTVELPR